jgi:hypothetical protein
MIASFAAQAQHREFARERFHTPHWGPPAGIVVPVLPPAYTTVWVAGVPYYYANDVYYGPAPGGYVVANPPAEEAAAPTPAPGPQAAAPQTANWYYCESAKAYYPYVAECKEGWRQVPATPPR